MSTILLWFRRDLRLADNTALHHALSDASRVISVYIHDPDEGGDWAAGAASRWWLHDSLAALGRSLRERGSRLILRQGPAAEVLPVLVEETGAAAVYWNRRYEPALQAADKALKAALTADGTQCRSFNAALLFEPWTVQTGAGGPYKVFTPFWRRCEQLGVDQPLLTMPTSLPAVPRGLASVALKELGLRPRVDWDRGLRASWIPGEAGAQDLLAAFAGEAAAAYPALRDRPDRSGTSRLSAALHFGELGPRQVVQALRSAAGGDSAGTEAVIRQLGWREFACHVLFHFPHTPDQPLDARYRAFPWRRGTRALRAWQQGRTGIPIVDAGMRELWTTGWMHNRVRMVVASFLTKHLRLRWQLGAQWFWDTLVDADLASNTLNWQWAAGCGADAAPYFRVFNPVRQGEKFDPDGGYVRHWVPELAQLPTRWLHQPWAAPGEILDRAGVRLGETYPAPLVDLATEREAAIAAWRATIQSGS